MRTSHFRRRAPPLRQTSLPPAGIPEPAARVAAAFHAILDDGDTPMGELRDATIAFAARLRKENTPPEQVLILLKTALTREERWLSLRPGCSPDYMPETREQWLYAQVFHWYLEGYYGSPRHAASS